MLTPNVYHADLRGMSPYGEFLATTRTRNTFLAFHYDLRMLRDFLERRARAERAQVVKEHPELANLPPVVPHPKDLGPMDLSQFVSSLLGPGVTIKGRPRKAYSQHSVHRVMTTLERLYAWMATVGQIPLDPARNPTAVFKMFAMNYQRWKPRPLAEKLREDMLRSLRWGSWSETGCSLVFLLSYHVGLRVFESAKLRKDEVSMPELTITVMGKGNKEAPVRMSTLTRDALALFMEQSARHPRCAGSPYVFPSVSDPQRPIWPGTLQNWFKRVAFWAGDPRWRERSVHQGRHTCGTQMAESGANAHAIKAQLRHYSIDMSQFYVTLFENRRALNLAYDKAFEGNFVSPRREDGAPQGTAAGQGQEPHHHGAEAPARLDVQAAG